MNQKSFMAFNLIGGAIWITSVVYVGYFLGYYLRGMGIDIDTIILPAIALILIVSVSPAIYQLAKDKKQRIAIWNTTKSELKKLFKKLTFKKVFIILKKEIYRKNNSFTPIKNLKTFVSPLTLQEI